MPAIPQYHQQISASGSLGPGAESVAAPVTSGVSILADGLSSLVDDQNRLKRFAQEKQNANDIVAANGVATQMQADWLQRLQDAKQKAAPGADGFTSDVSAAFDKDAAEKVKAITNPRAQRYLQEHVNRLRLSLQQDALHFEAQSRIANQQATLQTSIDSARNAAIFKPDDFARLVDEQSVAIDASSLDTITKQKLQQVSRQSIAAASVYSYIDRNPRAALTELKNEKSTNPAFRSLSADDRLTFINSAEVKVRQLETRAEADVTKREAAAEREVNMIQKNIASGVPITAEMWTESTKVLNGTTLAQMVKPLQEQELKVQSVLRQPIAAQMKFVQDANAELDSAGGDSNDRTVLKMLRDTIQQNITQIQKTPLLFIKNRTGQDVQPLDLAGVFNGDQAAVKQLSDRVTALRGAQKQYGSEIPLRPLLPQEAQMLTGLLDKSTPSEQSQIFAGLYNAVGDAQAYQGAMQQIAPDAPVKAIAGMLAAKEKTIPLEKHWFSPNVIGHSGDVSATMLQGLQLLSPTKTESGQDGKPKVGLYLPNDNTLQADFQNTIGTAFAGRPSAAENAFQAVKAYYVGRAAQTGRVAATNQDIDSKLVKESIRAILGDVVNYNGKGQVLAPWGMDSSTFEDKAHAALIAEGTKRGFTADALSALRNVGLRNLGDGTYYVTQGKNFVMDPQGHPLIIDVTQ